MFYTRVTELCAIRRRHVSDVCKAAGMHSLQPYKHSHGVPRISTVYRLARELDASIEDLVPLEEMPPFMRTLHNTLSGKQSVEGKIELYRCHHGYTYEAIASMCYATTGTVYKWVAGTATPTLHALDLFAKRADISLEVWIDSSQKFYPWLSYEPYSPDSFANIKNSVKALIALESQSAAEYARLKNLSTQQVRKYKRELNLCTVQDLLVICRITGVSIHDLCSPIEVAEYFKQRYSTMRQGERLSYLRTRNSISRRRLCELTGVPLGRIDAVEHGERLLRPEDIASISKVFEVPSDALRACQHKGVEIQSA